LGFDSNSSQRIKELLRRQWQKRLSQVQPKKTILREARLEITGSTLQRIRRSHQTRLSAPSRSGQPGFIVCAICGSQKYYSHVQRRYGVFSCESCSKFFARFLKQPKQLFCVKSGNQSSLSSVVDCRLSLQATVP